MGSRKTNEESGVVQPLPRQVEVVSPLEGVPWERFRFYGLFYLVYTIVMDLNRADIAWAAGLFEGEGCFYLARTQSYALRAALKMSDEDVVRRFHAIVRVGNIFGPTQYGTEKKPLWTWQAYKFEEVQAVIALFWHQLGQRRRDKAVEIIIENRKYRQGSTERLHLKLEKARAVKAQKRLGKIGVQENS